MNLSTEYDNLILLGFVHGINPTVFQIAKPWVINEIVDLWMSEAIPTNNLDDLGYSDQADITTIEQGFQKIKHTDENSARSVLKTFYLMLFKN